VKGRGLAAILLAATLAASCAGETFSLSANAAFSYQAVVDPTVERIAVLLTVTNKSEDDLQVNPADFTLRAPDRHIYPSNPAATAADANVVRRVAATRGLSGLQPMPVAILRKNDVLTVFVVFDVPAGVRPSELVYRQSDTDRVVDLSGAY
jgi:uncharacterized protein DUF4352